MKKVRWIVLSAVLLLTLPVQAQKTQTAEGYARIEQSEDKTAAECKAKVVQQARFDAVNTTFGSNITQNSVTMARDENGKSTTTFYMLGESDLRGVWVRDTEKPRIEPHIENGRTIWEAWVKGEVREQTRAKVDFEWKLTANGIGDQYQVKELHDGDAFYVKFRSPVKGYLLLFMADDKDVVSCLLPEEGEDYCMIDANKWYIFHYEKTKPHNCWKALLSKGSQVEYDQLYIVFSPQKISPPVRETSKDNSDLEHYNDDQKDIKHKHLSSLSFSAFHKYLGKLQHRDTEVQSERMLVKISKQQ